MTSLAIVDTGPLLASLNAGDPDHDSCLRALSSSDLDLVIPALCVAEVCYFAGRRLGRDVEARFLRGLHHFDVRSPAPDDWLRIADLVEQYADLGLGATDASVIALAEELDTEIVLTLDRRHFSVVKPRHCEGLRLLPSG